MRINFWIKTWNKSNIGFHLADCHPALEKYWLLQKTGSSVLVPLCGKSQDLIWLEENGHDVIGVEFVESAVLDFFRENNLSWKETEQYGHRYLSACGRNIHIFIADFIQFAEDYRGQAIESLYDRGALVALPEDMRTPYVAACQKLLTTLPRGLLVTMEYDQYKMEGPPFSVESSEVDRLWAGNAVLLEQADALSSMPRAVASGIHNLNEFYWALRFKNPGAGGRCRPLLLQDMVQRR